MICAKKTMAKYEKLILMSYESVVIVIVIVRDSILSFKIHSCDKDDG
jgi:hypothetical protein